MCNASAHECYSIIRGQAEDCDEKAFGMKMTRTFVDGHSSGGSLGHQHHLRRSKLLRESKAKGKACDHECCIKAHKEHKLL